MRLYSWVGAIALLFVIGVVQGEDLVPFVIPAEVDANSAITVTGVPPIRTDSERITARDGHFCRGQERVRVWGVNLSFGANFPTHEDAEKVAARLAAHGVNSVRCHHMDTSNWPDGIWDAEEPGRLSPEALDRLDYFIDQLARHGIYANLNLHVGCEHSKRLGLPATEHNYDKIYNLFTPALVEAQKAYARQLLGHVNVYRRVRYADDPAVAWVEITNENSFFMWDGEQTLRTLQPFYARLLQAQYNAWLKDRYQNQTGLAAAWSEGIVPLGDNLVQDSNFVSLTSGTPTKWHLEQHEDTRAAIGKQSRGLRVTVERHDGTGWHLQLNQAGLSLSAGQYYTVTFKARSDAARDVTCVVQQAHDPWQWLGLSRAVTLGSDGRTYRLGFVAEQSDDNARVNFAFGNSSETFYLDDVQLRPGGQVALTAAESMDQGTVALFLDNESEARQLDRLVFLAKTERAFFRSMKACVQQDLACRALVTGTIVFGPLGLYAQQDMDYIDSHAYWQHPQFPGRAWDMNNWQIDQTPMVDHPQEATVFRLAAERLRGKPYTVSEYNHPAPLDSQAACVPLIASFGAAQDWDGIWLYTYSHSHAAWDRERLNSFFDVDTNPAKWGFMRAGSITFRDGGLPPLDTQATIGLAEPGEDPVYALAAHHLRHGTDLFAIESDVYSMGRSNLLETQLYVGLTGKCRIDPLLHKDPMVTWFVDDGQGLYACAGGQVIGVVGHAAHAAAATGGSIRVASPEEFALMITTLDHRNVKESRRLLVTACGRCENTGMAFSRDRRTVGQQWGRAPVRIEPVRASLAMSDGVWTCWSLDAKGRRARRVPMTASDKGPILEIRPEYKTMWYLLER